VKWRSDERVYRIPVERSLVAQSDLPIREFKSCRDSTQGQYKNSQQDLEIHQVSHRTKLERLQVFHFLAEGFWFPKLSDITPKKRISRLFSDAFPGCIIGRCGGSPSTSYYSAFAAGS
jgi:hypothetical protein